jgi:hypothetical protein
LIIFFVSSLLDEVLPVEQPRFIGEEPQAISLSYTSGMFRVLAEKDVVIYIIHRDVDALDDVLYYVTLLVNRGEVCGCLTDAVSIAVLEMFERRVSFIDV